MLNIKGGEPMTCVLKVARTHIFWAYGTQSVLKTSNFRNTQSLQELTVSFMKDFNLPPF